jgi:hypothetical protein
MGGRRSHLASVSEVRGRRRSLPAVAFAFATAVAVVTAGASAATKPGARGESAGGAYALEAAAVAQQAPLAALRRALSANSRGMMHGSNVRPTKRALSTTAGLKRYLSSIGVDPAGVVVQRGRLNYAGPKCPGKAWNCTRASKVVQIASRVGRGRSLSGREAEPAGQNRVDCTPGTVFDTGPGLPAPGADCVIVQFTPPQGDNVATCILEFRTPGATQGCGIRQINANGRNRAIVRELAQQTDVPPQQFAGFDQIAIQTVIVQQFNDRGTNDAVVTQRIDQRIKSEEGGTSAHVAGAAHSIKLYQQGTGENRADIDEEYDQDINNLAANVNDIELGIQGITAIQCGASAGLCVQGAGKQTVKMRQSFSQALTAPHAVEGFQAQVAAPATDEDECVVDNNTSDAASLCGTVNQLSAGVSRAFVQQTGVQRATAPKTSRMAQRQDDPFSCCTGDPVAQGINPNDRFELDQDRTQLTNSDIYLQLADTMDASCLTSGSCAARQRANENGDVTQNSCDGSACHILITCPAGGPCTASSAPPPTDFLRRRS